MVKIKLHEEAIALRKKGYSYSFIRKNVPVSKSTLSEWLRDVDYEPNDEVKNRISGARVKSKQWHRKNKQKSLEDAQKRALEKIRDLSRRDLFMLGLALYIGEGGKSGEVVRIVNSDPCVISLAVRWFEETFDLKTQHFTLNIHLYPDNDIEKSVQYWSDVTGIPVNQFGKTQVDMRKKSIKKKGMLKYGTAHLYIHSRGDKRYGRNLFREISSMIDEVYRQLT